MGETELKGTSAYWEAHWEAEALRDCGAAEAELISEFHPTDGHVNESAFRPIQESE